MADQEMSVRDELEAAHAEVSERVEAPVPEPQQETVIDPDEIESTQKTVDSKTENKERDEKGKFKGKIKADDLTPVIKTKEAPAAWDAAAKEKFKALPPETQDYILKREEDAHKALTLHDEDRNFGKSLKEVISPYMATIQAEGGTPQGAVKDLLNTAYVLRTGSPQTKAALIQKVISQYGIDPNLVFQQPKTGDQNVNQVASQQQPPIDINQITQNIKMQLQQEMTTATVNEAYNAFASNPEFVHREHPLVKASMASLFRGENPPKDFKEAYTRALDELSKVTPSSTPQVQAKPAIDLAAKKKAASSVSGGPGTTVANQGNPNRSIGEELRVHAAELGW